MKSTATLFESGWWLSTRRWWAQYAALRGSLARLCRRTRCPGHWQRWPLYTLQGDARFYVNEAKRYTRAHERP